MNRRLLLAVLAAAPLAACGRRGRPTPPEGSTYPRTYPDITFPESQKSDAAAPEAELK